jgi:HSP20 family protein
MSQAMQKRPGSDPVSQERPEGERGRELVLRPAGDIFEHADGITLLLDMPGVSKDRLEIHSDRNSLVVEGTVAIDVPKDTESLYADVRSTRYRRTFSVSGEQLDADAIEASMKDGVLRIEIPKRAEIRPRKIEVQAG